MFLARGREKNRGGRGTGTMSYTRSPAHPSQASAQASALPRRQLFFLTGSSSALYRVPEDR